MYLADYHVHSSCSPDGHVTMAELAREGIARGLDELCFTDHVDTIEWGSTQLRTDSFDWAKAQQQYADAVAQYGQRIQLKLGAELGEAYLSFDCAARLMQDAPPLDFIIGSVHMTRDENGWFDLFYIDGDRDDAYYHAVIDAYLEEELDDCEENYLPQLAFDYARVERCAPNEATPAVRALIQKQRDALEEMSLLMREIDASHIRYRKRAVQRAQFLLLSDRSSQGSVTALLRRYAEDIRTPEQLFEPDDGPVAKRLHLYPAAVFGEKFLYPPAAQRTAEPLAPVRTEVFDPEQLKKEQQLLLDYARLAVTEENVALLARQALAARPQVNAALLADEYPNDFARIIGLHTYSQSPHRDYDIQLTGNWVERGGFRFEDFVLTRRREEENGNH